MYSSGSLGNKQILYGRHISKLQKTKSRAKSTNRTDRRP